MTKTGVVLKDPKIKKTLGVPKWIRLDLDVLPQVGDAVLVFDRSINFEVKSRLLRFRADGTIKEVDLYGKHSDINAR